MPVHAKRHMTRFIIPRGTVTMRPTRAERADVEHADEENVGAERPAASNGKQRLLDETVARVYSCPPIDPLGTSCQSRLSDVPRSVARRRRAHTATAADAFLPVPRTAAGHHTAAAAGHAGGAASAAAAGGAGLDALALADAHGRLVVDGGAAHALLDLASHCQKGLLDVGCVLGRGLEEGDAEAVGELLCKVGEGSSASRSKRRRV